MKQDGQLWISPAVRQVLQQAKQQLDTATQACWSGAGLDGISLPQAHLSSAIAKPCSKRTIGKIHRTSQNVELVKAGALVQSKGIMQWLAACTSQINVASEGQGLQCGGKRRLLRTLADQHTIEQVKLQVRL